MTTRKALLVVLALALTLTGCRLLDPATPGEIEGWTCIRAFQGLHFPVDECWTWNDWHCYIMYQEQTPEVIGLWCEYLPALSGT